MTELSCNFAGAIPITYDRCLGPNIFDPYGRAIAARVAAANPANVLELAAGTGIVTRHLRDSLPAEVGLTATDLNADMLNIARAKFGPHEPVSFGHADAHLLPYDDSSFDLIACQFGVMFFRNRIAAYKEAARVVRPGGRFLFSTWGTQAGNPFSEIAHETMAKFFNHEPPGFYKTPYSQHDPDAVIADLAAAGLSDVAHTAIAHERQVKDYATFAYGLIAGHPAFEAGHKRGRGPKAISDEIAARMRARFGPEPSQMPMLAHMFGKGCVTACGCCESPLARGLPFVNN